MGLIDLHTHSTVSDGTLTPAELVQHAKECGVSVMALTDHDSLRGVNEALEAGSRLGVTVIPGIEISAEYRKKDIHILGYFIDTKNREFNEILNNAWLERENRNEIMAERFRRSGIPITTDALKKLGKSSVITRAHFARWLVENKYCKTTVEAFDKFLGDDRPYFVPRTYLSRQTAINAIKNAGGIPVLAHPMLYRLEPARLETLIAELKEMGIEGLETYYSGNVSNDEDVVRHLALKYDLLMTGGSDFHGSNKPGLEIGTGRSNLNVPESVYQILLEHYNKKNRSEKEQ